MKSIHFYFLILLCTYCINVNAQTKRKKSEIVEREIGILFGTGYKKSFLGEIGIYYSTVNEYDICSSVTISTEKDFKNRVQTLKLGYWRCYNFINFGYGASLNQSFSANNTVLSLRPEIGVGNGALRAYITYDVKVLGKAINYKSGFLIGASVRWDIKELKVKH
jgi:hypothetical protein